MDLLKELEDFNNYARKYAYKSDKPWTLIEVMEEYKSSNSSGSSETQAVRQNEDAENVCECDTPIIRSSVNMDGYCGNCGKDIK